jgi:hypothetical protein
MSEQQYQSEVMDELRQITEGFFKTADAFVARQKQTIHDPIEVCPYCGSERGKRFACCGEVHFVTMSREAYENGEELP